MLNCINLINGRMRLKVPGFKESCQLLGVNFIEANYLIEENSAYLAGLVDTDGSVVMNLPSNRIELNLEFQQNEYSAKLDFSLAIPGAIPRVTPLIKRNQTQGKIFYSIRFSYDCVSNMLPVYQFFKVNRLYSIFKFYRVMQIKRFLELRPFHNYPEDSPEFKLFVQFITEYNRHLNEQKALPSFIMLAHNKLKSPKTPNLTKG
jgi:hypothetical protein